MKESCAAPAIDDVTTAALTAHAAALSGGRNSPAVRRLLSEHKLHAADVRGSGAGGRITVDDVLEHVAKKRQPASPSTREQPAAAQSAGQGDACCTRRYASASRSEWSRACSTAPHVTTIFEVDLSAVLAHRFEASRRLRAARRLAHADRVLSRGVRGCDSRDPGGEQPLDRRRLEVYDNIDIGVGTAVEGKGLVVPVVRAVQSLDLFGIAKTLSDLVARARKTSSRRPTFAAERSRSPITASAAAWSRRRSSSINRSRRFSASASWRSGPSWSTTTARTGSSCSRAAT